MTAVQPPCVSPLTHLTKTLIPPTDTYPDVFLFTTIVKRGFPENSVVSKLMKNRLPDEPYCQYKQVFPRQLVT